MVFSSNQKPAILVSLVDRREDIVVAKIVVAKIVVAGIAVAKIAKRDQPKNNHGYGTKTMASFSSQQSMILVFFIISH
jgi:hypothetical protein